MSSCDLPRRNSFTCCSAHTTAWMDTSPPFFGRLATMFGKTGRKEDTISLRRNRTDSCRECRLQLSLNEWIRPFPRSHSLSNTCTHTLLTRSLSHSLTHSLAIHLLTSLIIPPTRPPAHPPTRPSAHPPTRPPTR